MGASDFRLSIEEVLTKLEATSKLGKHYSLIENELEQKKQTGPTQTKWYGRIRLDIGQFGQKIESGANQTVEAMRKLCATNLELLYALTKETIVLKIFF